MHCCFRIARSWPFALALSACSSASPALKPAALQPQIAPTCPLPPGEPSDPDAPLRVFVEIATITAPHSGGSVPEDWHAGSLAEQLNEGHFTIPSVAGVLATNDVPVTVPWDPNPAQTEAMAAPEERWKLSLKAHLEPAQPEVVTLELTLTPAPPLGIPAGSWKAPVQETVHTSVKVGDQQPTVLQPLAQHTGGEPVALVLTPAIIRNDGDLRALFDCKLKRARP